MFCVVLWPLEEKLGPGIALQIALKSLNESTDVASAYYIDIRVVLLRAGTLWRYLPATLCEQ